MQIINNSCEIHLEKIHSCQSEMRGPNLYEVEYLKSLQEELSIFLKSKNLNTIDQIAIVFQSPSYYGWMKVS